MSWRSCSNFLDCCCVVIGTGLNCLVRLPAFSLRTCLSTLSFKARTSLTTWMYKGSLFAAPLVRALPSNSCCSSSLTLKTSSGSNNWTIFCAHSVLFSLQTARSGRNVFRVSTNPFKLSNAASRFVAMSINFPLLINRLLKISRLTVSLAGASLFELVRALMRSVSLITSTSAMRFRWSSPKSLL